MVKNFDIKEFDNKVLVFSTSYINPLEYRLEIESWLSKKKKQEVIFDLLLTNGNTVNRYVKAEFKENGLTNFKKCLTLNNDIKAISNKFYMTNKHLLNNSILSKSQKFLAERGKLISIIR